MERFHISTLLFVDPEDEASVGMKGDGGYSPICTKGGYISYANRNMPTCVSIEYQEGQYTGYNGVEHVHRHGV